MIEINKGITKKHVTSKILVDFFEQSDFDGYLYIGYPILFTGDDSVTVDALWISEKYGIIIFDLIEKIEELDNFTSRQDIIFSKIESQLIAYPELKKGRREFLVNIEVISYAGELCETNLEEFLVSSTDDLNEFIQKRNVWKNNQLFTKVLSILQSVVSLKKVSTREIKKENSRGAKVRDLETTIATLDRNQEKAVIEYFEGIQRIRGLAGSGKTIVLALKAAYFHTQNPDWDIAITFNTRSLKNQFRDLITRFCVEKKRETPNWKKIKIVNAWGSSKDKEDEKGIYYDYCITNQTEYLDFRRAKKSNPNNPFKYACGKAIKESKKSKEKYDAILVDEAQDLSEEFLNICYRLLKSPSKRLIYAYDELQKLNEGESLPNPQEFLIPKTKTFDDRILKVCYRNSRPLLVTAHSLGFGIYRESNNSNPNLVQFFDQPQLWKDVGYSIKKGEFKPHSNVILSRSEESSPRYLETHSNINDLLVFKSFEDKDKQAEYIANEIEKNLNEEELLHNDIIVINPMALTTKDEVSLIRSKLMKKEINSHISGAVNANRFFEEDSITFTGINRAKGNEVPMVYIINSQDCYSGNLFNNRDLIKKRNILFTAITRSKAWVRVVGVGNKMDKLIEEYNKVKAKNFELDFIYPTKEEIEKMNIIHRDITKTEEDEIKNELESLFGIQEILKKIKRKEVYVEDYPDEVQELIKKLLND
ncbi:ATP-binding domain-containing protein [Galbibacter sp. BG1]|uniref:DEAD/DEAH box helicase n=1 Tax=Galbibacter sp. BG1 TaxID=1170699 RepID=UPI0015B8EEBC|nr:ATP-binding domain-containing protein [Galbibacter sp. BG1]QLE01988.1 ATP-binding domain-containing protein [Galbibacter sp. BG1]